MASRKSIQRSRKVGGVAARKRSAPKLSLYAREKALNYLANKVMDVLERKHGKQWGKKI
jgi:hypothetical protein